MENFLQRQQIITEGIEKIVVNLKKDSLSRKTPDYAQKRLEALESLWSEFEFNHKQLLTYEKQSNAYFTTNAYQTLRQTFLTTKETLQTIKDAIMGTSDRGSTSKTDELISQQGTNFKAFMRIVRNISAAELKEKWEIEDKLQTLQSRWKLIDDLHWQIDNLLIGTNLAYEDEYSNHEAIFERNKRELNSKLSSTMHRYQAVPQIEIPTFSGNYTQWPTFIDLYSEAIHNNAMLTKAQKMQHLKGKLRGEAERLVQHLTISAENYDTCWELLTHRYNNLQLLFTKQIQVFMGQPAIQQQTAFEVKRLHDTSLETIHAIHNLRIDTTTWDPILVHILTGKLDPETYAAYMEMRKAPRELPSFEELIGFLENKFTALEPVNMKNKTNSVPKRTTNEHHPKPIVDWRYRPTPKTYFAQSKRTCPVCNMGHILIYCKTFLNMPPDTKMNTLKQLRICQNCMFSHNGKSCTSNKTCKICSKQHHTTLHELIGFDEQTISNEVTKQSNVKPFNKNTAEMTQRRVNHAAGNLNEVLLATVQIKVKAKDGTFIRMRCLLDQGSQINLITESAAQLLGLQRRKQHATVSGVGITANQSSGTVQLVCESLSGDYTFTKEALVMKKMLNNLPNYSFEKQQWSHLHNINLADPDYNVSRPVDILLDASVYAEIVLDGILRGSAHAPIAQQTTLGWVLLGNVTTFNCHAVLNNLDEVAQFWESEEITESSNNMTVEEEYCESLFQKTTRRLPDGRYVVRLPTKNHFEQNLGASKPQAVAQFCQLERRLAKNAQLKQAYTSFMDQYLELGHMKQSTQPRLQSCFLPHHGVMKLDSTTTKLRVVFNASAKTKSGCSLNDLLECGPKLQQDLQLVILRWRMYQYVYTADIEKFYRQIRVHEDQQHLQKIVWRDSTDKDLQEYQLCTITYGTKPASFLAMRTVKQLVDDDGQRFPLAASILSHQLYVDDLLGGSNNLLEAQAAQQELINILQGGGFNLRKWASNDARLLENLPQNLISQNMLDFKNAETNKTLGITWNPCTDMFTFKQELDTGNGQDVITKRSLLSDLSKIYDPLGWLSPTTIKAKIIFQQVWATQTDWDEPLPKNIADEWKQYRQDLQCIQNITIPRGIGYTQTAIELHGFSDASEKAYGCVIYCKSTDTNNQQVVKLLTAKTKLVPLKKPMSLPRLELCAAHLLSKLMKKVTESINVQTVTVHAWTDSMVVLGWLNGETSRWKSFVANRVRSIQENIPASSWNHVKSKDNAADCASRGLSPTQLLTHSLWWDGPNWLKNKIISTKPNNFVTKEEEKKLKKVCAIQKQAPLIEELLQKHSSMARVIRILTWIMRFINKARGQNNGENTLYLTTTELDITHNIIIKTVQNNMFLDDNNRLQNNKKLRLTSNILTLNPILDEHGILRVGGRLTHSDLDGSQKHPIIISNNSRLTELLISQAHLQTLHGGARLTLMHLRNKYWILGGMRTVKKQLLKCVRCHRYRSSENNQLMADLPRPRVTASRPFTHTGVDFTGQVEVKANKGRGIKTTAGYIAIFICLCTKAIHLELVSDLSAATFLAALRRFCARRGTPICMYSDNGTNFTKSAKTLLKEHKEALQYYINSEVINNISALGITWNFNAPSWPSAGGLWEAAVRSMKHHLKRVLGEQKLTYEEFLTLLTQIEACLNSRPLVAVTEDMEDINCLTPGHFLVGGPVLAPPLTSDEQNISLNNRWQLTKKMSRDFWKRWSSEYLQSLQTRGKWHHSTKNIEVDDIVLVKEDNLPPARWLLGRVTETHPGPDGRVRVVTLKTKTNKLKRPVIKLSRLPIENNKGADEETSEQQTENITVDDSTRKRTKKRPSYFTYLCMWFMLITTCTASHTSQFYNVTELNTLKLVYFDKVADLHIVQDEWKMVVYYNMSTYWRSLSNLEQYVSHLTNLCKEEPAYLSIATQFQHEITELKLNNYILRSEHIKRSKRGLIDGVGYIANSLFGVLDERFAKTYHKDIKLIHENENHVQSIYKQHTSIIEGEYNLLKRNEDVMNKQFSIIGQHLQELDNKVKLDHENAIYITSTALAASLILSNLHRVQHAIMELVTDVRNGHLDTNLLKPDEFQQQLNIISRQIPNDLSLPCINNDVCIQQMYKRARVHVRPIEDFLIFEVKLPLISNERYELNRVISIPKLQGNGTIRILPSSKYLAVNLRKDLLLSLTDTDLTSCEHYKEHQLSCTLNIPIHNIEASSSICEAQIINNGNLSSCKTVTADDCVTDWIMLHSRGAWLFSCCEECSVRVFCPAGIAPLVLRHTGIITLAEGCVIKGEHVVIHSHNKLQSALTINPDEEYIPESGINNIVSGSDFKFKPEDHMKQLETIKQNIKQVKTEQETLNMRADSHESHHYAIYGVLLLVGAIIGAFAVIKIKQGHENRRRAKPESKVEKTEDHTDNDSVELRSYRNTVDVASSPIPARRV